MYNVTQWGVNPVSSLCEDEAVITKRQMIPLLKLLFLVRNPFNLIFNLNKSSKQVLNRFAAIYYAKLEYFRTIDVKLLLDGFFFSVQV